MDLRYAPAPADAKYSTVTAASQQLSDLVAGTLYVLCSTVPLWIAQGTTPTAAAGTGNLFWPANTPLGITGSRGAKLAVIREGGVSGAVSLTPVDIVR
jgi:hypothetical protein